MSENRFERIRRAIVDRAPMSPPPHFDVGVGGDVKTAFLGRPVKTLQDDVAFWSEAGLCLYPVSAVLRADDIAYFSGPMIKPDVLRRHVFPAYKRMGDFCRPRGVIYLYHSDGQMKDLVADIVACGFVGLHPIEPKPMNAVELKKQWGDRLCLLGHIDVDLLARGTPQQVRDQTRKNLDALARDGGYCPGSGNSVPDYVPVQNFIAMIEAIRDWR